MDSEKVSELNASLSCPVCGLEHEKQGLEHCVAAQAIALSTINVAGKDVHKAFGAPGHYGYSSKEGISLRLPYDACNELDR